MYLDSKESIRILQVVTTMDRGGLETMIMNYYRNIDRTKVQFDFLTHTDVHQDFEEEIAELGGRIYRLPRLNPFSIHYHKALNRFFRENKEYRIVHCHRDCMAGIPLKAAKKAGVPVRIAHGHTTNQVRDGKLPLKLIYKRMIPQYATDLFACSKAAGDWMFSGGDYRIMRNAVDAGRFRFDQEKAKEMREELSLQGCFVMGHVGQFRIEKNHLFLIDIFYELQKKDPMSRLVLIGQGIQLQAVLKKIKEYDIEDRVILLGARADIPELLQALDVFVLPSLYEGFPVSMIEAQAAGLPCFISDMVPLECKITEEVEQLALSDGAQVWAEKILAFRGMSRRDNYDLIVAAGFDIKSNAKWLEEFYCNAQKG